MQSALNMLGLCMRAGRLACGIPAVEKALRQGKARLVLIDEEASKASHKCVEDACGHHGVRLLPCPAGLLGDAIGRPGRMAVAVMDAGFAQQIRALFLKAESAKD